MWLGLWSYVWWPGEPSQFWAPLGLTLLFPFLGLAGIVAALLLWPGRRWAAIAAILIEAGWGAMAAALGCKILEGWPRDSQLLWQVTAAAALFLVAAAGLLLPPVRAYTGLVRRLSPAVCALFCIRYHLQPGRPGRRSRSCVE
jgi:hypothetical protein